MSILENVYLDCNNQIRWIISDENGPIDFVENGTTLMEVYLDDILVTSATSEVNYTDGGLVTLALGLNTDLLDNHRYAVALKVYDGTHPEGQLLMHPTMGKSSANICTKSITS